MMSASWYANHASGQQAEIQRLTNKLVLEELLRLALNEQANAQVRALALDSVATLNAWLQERINSERDVPWRAHYRAATALIDAAEADPDRIRALPPVTVPPGSPIGAY